MSWVEAEYRAKSYMKDKHPRVRRIDFERAWRERGVWTVKGEMTARASVFSAKKWFRLQMNAETGEVTGYVESS